MPLKIKRLAQEPERFFWALSMAQSRCINKQIRIGALVQDANMLVPYAGEPFYYSFFFFFSISVQYLWQIDHGLW